MEYTLEGIKDNMVTTTERVFMKLEKLVQSYQETCNKLLEEVKALTVKQKDNEDTISKLSSENARIVELASGQEKEVKALKQTIAVLEEENHGFKKVSQIIHYEKENNKLRQQVTKLEERLKKQDVAPIATVVTIENVVEEPVADAGVEVYEKKINKIVYFVSNDESMRIFEKTEDGDIGEEVGHLETVNGKLKPIWLAD